MSKPDDARKKSLRRLLNQDGGEVAVAVDDLRWLLDEASRLQQSNDRLRKQNRRLRRKAGEDVDATDEVDAASEERTEL